MATDKGSNPQVAVIVGGGAGISASCARLFAAVGMQVAIVARAPDKASLVTLSQNDKVTVIGGVPVLTAKKLAESVEPILY